MYIYMHICIYIYREREREIKNQQLEDNYEISDKGEDSDEERACSDYLAR